MEGAEKNRVVCVCVWRRAEKSRVCVFVSVSVRVWEKAMTCGTPAKCTYMCNGDAFGTLGSEGRLFRDSGSWNSLFLSAISPQNKEVQCGVATARVCERSIQQLRENWSPYRHDVITAGRFSHNIIQVESPPLVCKMHNQIIEVALILL